MTEPFIPRSVAQVPERVAEFTALAEGVPPYLRDSLLGWIGSQFRTVHRVQGDVNQLWEQITGLERALRLDLRAPDGLNKYRLLTELVRDDQELCLDVVDYLLSKMENPSFDSHKVARQLFDEAGSAWAVHYDRHQHRLVRRVEESALATFRLATSKTDNSSTHLTRSWNYAFGRRPEPGPAFQEAVSALEASYDRLVIPNNPRATLGSITDAINTTPSKWTVRLLDESVPESGVRALHSVLRNIWKTQERHGSSVAGAPTTCTLEEAQDAVVLAAALVQIARQGGFAPS